MSYAILIPGKSNSSRLPGKNFMKFNGKPLIDYTIEFAKKLGFPIYVSTDVRDFKRDGVITIVRPPFLGKVDMRLVVDHALTKIKEKDIILLQVTSPLRRLEEVKKCLNAYIFHENKNIVTIDRFNLKPNGYCFIFPRNRYIWDGDLHLIMTEKEVDIDYIWDFRIAEAIQRGDYS